MGRQLLIACACATVALLAHAVVTPLTAGASVQSAQRSATIDRDADGRLDAIVVRLPAKRLRVPRLRVHVRGYRVARLVRLRPGLRVVVGETARGDTEARPMVVVTANRRLRARMRARDAAAPVPVAAHAVAGIPGRLAVLFSERIRYRALPGRPGVAVVDALGRPLPALLLRQRGPRSLAVELPAGAQPAAVRVRRGRSVRDLAGNAVGLTRTLRVRPSGVTRQGAGSLARPIDSRFQTAVGFGERSHWLQPWRAYLDTVSADRFRSALGINFPFESGQAGAAARIVAASGFRRARVEVSWGAMDYAQPTRLRPEHAQDLTAALEALRDNGLRPLILLNGHHGNPAPFRRFAVELTSPARAGDREVQLTPASAAEVIPGLSGLSSLTRFQSPEVFFSGLRGTTADLSKPLPVDLPAGLHPAVTLRYAPFRTPYLADGTPDPAFERTLAGWLDFVDATTRLARVVLGGDEFDVEIWNELSFGSDFLDIDNYYEPDVVTGRGDQLDAILHRTVQWLRDPANGRSRVGITNGFASQRPWPSPVLSPAGLTALSKHPYSGRRSFPAARDSAVALDAGGRPVGEHTQFEPSYVAYFPEYFLTAIQTETLIRDISPIETLLRGVPHGRGLAPPGGSPVAVWVTETGLAAEGIAPEAASRFKAKAVLRATTSFVNKGSSVVHLFTESSANGPYGLVDLAEPGGGEAMTAMRRLVAAIGDARPVRPRSLSLLGVSDTHGKRQFEGDGTLVHPPLYDRDVLAFLPFQSADDRFVVAVYVMTRNLAKVYRPNLPESDSRRYDLEPERFTLTVGGVDGRRAHVSALDPLTGTGAPAEVVGRDETTITVSFAATDYPRLLIFDRA